MLSRGQPEVDQQAHHGRRGFSEFGGSLFAFGTLPALFNFRDEHDRANADANGIERVLASPVIAASMPSMNILRR